VSRQEPALRGVVRDRATGRGLSGYRITAYAAGRAGDPAAVVGRGVSSLTGAFQLRAAAGAVVEVRNRFGRVVHLAALRGAPPGRLLTIEVEIRPELQRPEGIKGLDAFEPLRAQFGDEIEALARVGVATPAALRGADLDSLAARTRLGADRLGALALAADLPGLDRPVALAFSRAGARSRDSLARREPAALLRAIDSAGPRPAGVVEWVTRAQGHDLAPFSAPMREAAVRRDIERVYEAVRATSAATEFTEVDNVFHPVARHSALARARALLEEAGVTDLSALGRYRVEAREVIHPGHHVALPPYVVAGEWDAAASALGAALVEHGRRFKAVEMRNNVLRFVQNPVTEAVIVGSVVDFAEDGQLVIGEDVTSLVIITEEILYSQVNAITYESRDRAPDPRPPFAEPAATGKPDWNPSEYAPGDGNKGANGGNGAPGEPGQRGVAGDALPPAPDVTIYVQRTPEGLPDIDVGGRRGGRGQAGQAGGRGGDGARGRPSKSELFWCKRGVGEGGDGGDGGRGGDGGPGGRGGSGGTVAINSLEDNIGDLLAGRQVVISNAEGVGGSGGAAGAGGNAGRGGWPGEKKGFCDEEPDRVGDDGTDGEDGAEGPDGPEGDPGGFTVQPITLSEWNAAFNSPWILRLEPWDAPASSRVRIHAMNLTDDARLVLDGAVLSRESLQVDVDAGWADHLVSIFLAGGPHSVQLRITAADGSYVYSQIVHLTVLPTLAAVVPEAGLPGTRLSLHGSGFTAEPIVRIGGRSFLPDAVGPPEIGFTPITLTLPADEDDLALREGVQPVEVVNSDGRVSGQVDFRLSLTRRIKVKAWRVIPDDLDGGSYNLLSAEKIEELFVHVYLVWTDAGIYLELDQVVGTAVMEADLARNFRAPDDPDSDAETIVTATGADGEYLHFDPGALNLYFVRNIEGGGVLGYTHRPNPANLNPTRWVIIQDTPIMSDLDNSLAIAHEVGHTLGLSHICTTDPDADEETLFQRECAGTREEREFLMYPADSFSRRDGEYLSPPEIETARVMAAVWYGR
jgi:hypothetical protein